MKNNQQKFVKNLSRNFLVEAGAGTGKTACLVERILNLISRLPDFKMGELVALTFTEKAAAEMKIRLRQGLEQAKRKAGRDKAGVFEQALLDFERAQISTIHSFCAGLLRLLPVEAGVPPGFRVLDENAAGGLFERQWEAWLDRLEISRREIFGHLSRMGISLSALHELAQELNQNRDLFLVMPGTTPEFPKPEDLRQMTKDFNELLARYHASDSKQEKLTTELDRFSSLLKLYENDPESLERVFCQFDYGLKQDQVWKRNPGATEFHREFSQMLAGARYRWLTALLGLCREFILELEKEKSRAEVLDFQDLLLKTRDLLRDNPGARDYFKARFKYLLVDEFQDTDPLQMEIVFFLAEDEGSKTRDWKKVQLKPGKLFLVGDPRQSIYRFRRADISVYDSAKEALLSAGEKKPQSLAQNYRSSPGLLDWVNLTFKNLFIQERGIQPEYLDLNASQQNPENRPPEPKPVIVLELEEDTKLKRGKQGYGVDNVRIVEARAIADFLEFARGRLEIAEKQEQGTVYVKADYRHFAVLFHSTNHIRFVESELKNRGIPFATEGSKEFLERDEIAGLRFVLKAIANPADECSLVGALRSLFIGASDIELYAFRQAGGQWNWQRPGKAAEKFPVLEQGFAFLQELHASRDSRSIAWLIEKIIDRSHLRKLRQLHPRFNQALLNLERLKAISVSFGQDPESSLDDFISWMDGLENENKSWPELFAENENNAVRLLTFHKSKGLEFPVVILANLSNSMPIEKGMVLKNWEKHRLEVKLGYLATPDFSAMKEQEEKYLNNERVRTLFVAATRARQYLVIPDHRMLDQKENPKQWISLLTNGLPKLNAKSLPRPEIIKTIKTSELERVKATGKRTGLEIFLKLKPRSTSIAEAKARLEKEQEQILARAGQFVPLSAPSREEQWEEFGEKAETARAEARDIGTIVHKVIELAGRKDLETALLLAQRLASENASEKSFPPIQELVRAFFQKGLISEIEPDNIFQEVPFLIEYDNRLYRGKIDWIGREKDRLHILDFKTDSIKPAQLDERAEKYRRQMQIYAKAVALMKNQPPAQTAICFLKPRLKKEV